MNYIKKLKSLGFKKNKIPLVIYTINDYKHNILFSEIENSTDFFNKKINKQKNELKIKSAILYPTIPEMRLLMDEKTMKYLTTYYLNISQSITIYLTINNQSFTCFLSDKDAEPIIIDGLFSPHIEKKDNLIILNGEFNDNFWKEILSSMPVKYKRDILLKQII